MPDGGNPVLVTEPPLSSTSFRELVVSLLFEQFGVSSACVAMSGAMSLYATGARTGLVVEVGEGLTQVVPIYEEYVLPQAVRRVDCGGRDLTEYLTRLLRKERGYVLETPAQRWYAKALKERACTVALNPKSDLGDSEVDNGRPFQLPDGSVVQVGKEGMRCPEILFRPNLVNMESPGIHELAFQAVSKCEVDTHRELYGNVVLAGGTMNLPGIRERMLKELITLVPPSVNVRVTVPSCPENAAFFGGSVLASIEEIQRNWVTAKEYEEHGASIIHSRSLCLTEGLRKET